MGHTIGSGVVYLYVVAEIQNLVTEAIWSGERATMLALYDTLDRSNNGIHDIDWNRLVP